MHKPPSTIWWQNIKIDEDNDQGNDDEDDHDDENYDPDDDDDDHHDKGDYDDEGEIDF